MSPRKSIETRVVDTILQEKHIVTIGSKEYVVPAPTLATLFLVSREISSLTKLPESKRWEDVLASTYYAPRIAKILAMFIIGAKALKSDDKRGIRRLLPFLKSPIHKQMDALTNEIMDECTPVQVGDILVDLLNNAQLNDFFAVTTFLREANPTRPTKVVKTKTIARGQS